MSDFTHADLPRIDKRVLRMGFAGNYGCDSDDARYAADRGVNYWVSGASYGKVREGIVDIIGRDREAHVVAHLGGLTAFGWQVRKGVESILRKLKTDYIDIYQLGWLGKTSRLSPGIVDAVEQLKEEGKVRALGCSIHDRQRAGRLAAEGPMDMLMIRYSAKHPGAEQDIFPHLDARDPAIVAYTAVAWGQLIKAIKGMEMPPFPGQQTDVPPLTPALCYRFVLSNPAVHLVLTGPKNREQLAANLDALDAGPLPEDELAWVRDYGRKVKAAKKLDFV